MKRAIVTAGYIVIQYYPIGVMSYIKEKGIEVIGCEPALQAKSFFQSKVSNNLLAFVKKVDVIIANRYS